MDDDDITYFWRQCVEHRPVPDVAYGGLGLIAVAPIKSVAGVYAPDFKGRTYDFRRSVDSPANTNQVRLSMVVLPLRTALLRKYQTEAHMVLYLLEDERGPFARQPRINKHGGGIKWILAQGLFVRAHYLAVDLDNPDHGQWTPETLAAMRDRFAASELASTCCSYFTKRGARLLQPLERGYDVGEIEARHAGWVNDLENEGFEPDPTCKDWTRFFKLPYARREDDPAYVPPPPTL